MSATGSFFRTIWPPSFSMCFNAASMSGTSTVMTVFLTSLLRFVSPPLMARFRRYLGLLVHLCSPNHVVLHSGVLADVPSEGFLVEALCAFLVVGRYLKVYDPSVMHISARARAAKGRCNKSSLYFSSLESLRPILDNVAARVCPAGSFCHS